MAGDAPVDGGPRTDAPPVAGDAGPLCPGGMHTCLGRCVDDQGLGSCGSSCTPCPVPTNATVATCDGTTCGFTCKMGFHPCGAACVSDDAVETCGVRCAPCETPRDGTAACEGKVCVPKCGAARKPCLGACIDEGASCNGQCPAGTHNCAGLCSSNTSVNSCGPTSCDTCVAPVNAAARCTSGGCGWDCVTGYVKCGAACAAGNCCVDADCKTANPAFVCRSNKCVPPPDTAAPAVSAISPGIKGAAKDANIVITFSEAMNRDRTEAAFAGPSLGPVKFAWSAGDTVLTVNPDTDLTYAEGANPALVTATPYSFTITSGATDVAGNPLPAYPYTFSTLRRISTPLQSASDPNLDGFAVANGRDDHPYDWHMAVGYSNSSIMKGFATIDIASLPTGITRFESALFGVWQVNFYGPDMTRVGSIQVEHVRFATINAAAVNAARLRPLGTLSTNITSERKERDVTPALQEDYDERVTRANRSQFRIFPEKPTTGDFFIGYATIEEGDLYEPRLKVVYLVP